MLQWGFLLLSVLCNAIGVFVIKLQLNKLGEIPLNSLSGVFSYFIELIKSPLSLIGAFLFSLAPIFFVIALSRMEVSLAYPVQVGINFLILILLAFIVLKEPFSLNKFLASLLILISLYLLYKQ